MQSIIPQKYNGLTILLNRPSRFDTNKLISGKAGEWFDLQLERRGVHREHTIIESVGSWKAKNMFINPDTRTILALGDEAHYQVKSQDTTLGENRGSPFKYRDTDINVISSFAPQDAYDLRDYEGNINASVDGEYDMEEAKNDKTFNKGHGVTSRRNYKFWLGKDIYKTTRIHTEGITTYSPEYCIYPSLEEIYHILTTTRDAYFHIDIEVDIDTLDITCFAFTFEHTIRLNLPFILRRDNITALFLRSVLADNIREESTDLRFNTPVDERSISNRQRGIIFVFQIRKMRGEDNMALER